MSKIDKIISREILDSRGHPTVSTIVFLDNDKYYFASVPSGASIGSSEAHELRDRDVSRYNGLGVLNAVDNVNTKINKLLKGVNIKDTISIDKKILELDGTDNKSNLGANAILSVSMAVNKAAAGDSNMQLYRFINKYYNFPIDPKLPIPLVNIFNGGKHADTNLDFQELWIVPRSFKNFKEKLRVSSEIFHEFGNVLSENGYDTDLGNEGGYAPDLNKTDDAWDMILKAIKRAGYDTKKVVLGLDAGASTFYNKHSSKYKIKLDRKDLGHVEMINYYLDWLKKYPIRYIEDPLDEEAWDYWVEFKKLLDLNSNKIAIIGDDLLTTNVSRLKKAIELNAVSGIIIKLNQIGTVSETINCIKLAQENSIDIIVSHRSGETCDDFIADLAVGVGAEHIKTGSIARGERICKYNRLLAIEDELL